MKIGRTVGYRQQSLEETAREQVVLNNMGLVHSVAKAYLPEGESLDFSREDIIQVGTVGLIDAVDRFDPERGIKFSTFAVPTIRGEILKFFRDPGKYCDEGVEVTRGKRDFYKKGIILNRTIRKLWVELERSPRLGEVVEVMGISEEEVLEVLVADSFLHPKSLDRDIYEEDESRGVGRGFDDFIPGGSSLTLQEDSFDGYGIDEYASAIIAAIQSLAEEDRKLIELYYYKDMSYREIAEMFGCKGPFVEYKLNTARNMLKARASKIVVEERRREAEAEARRVA